MRGAVDDLIWMINEDRGLANMRGSNGKTPIMIAIEHEKHEIIGKLLEIGVDLSCSDSAHGNTALHIVAMKGDHISCKLIFSAYPEASLMMNYKGETPIHLAVRS